jgi:hypothetical protein
MGLDWWFASLPFWAWATVDARRVAARIMMVRIG